MPQDQFAPSLRLPTDLAFLLLSTALEFSQARTRAFRVSAKRSRAGRTLRPGPQTPLWNQLRSLVQAHVTRHGDQVKLARLLGLPRQRVHAFLTQGGQMPDAERTLQLLAWLLAMQEQRPPA